MKFKVKRAEYPEWFSHINEFGYNCWTSNPVCAAIIDEADLISVVKQIQTAADALPMLPKPELSIVVL